MISARRLAAAAAATLALSSTPAAAQYTTINISSLTNDGLASSGAVNGALFPYGSQTLGSIPFLIPSGTTSSGAPEARMWYANTAASGGSGTVSVTIPVNVFGVVNAYTLINTGWGAPGPTSYASVTFTGSGGATYTKSLIGNVDIRDYNQNVYTNSINGTTTQQVFTTPGGNQRLDRQMFALPAAFATQTLLSIKLEDSGNVNFQRTFLSGVTVQAASTVPEPATLALVAGGLALVGVGARRRRTT